MQPSICVAALAATTSSIFQSTTTPSVLQAGKKAIFNPAPMPNIDRHDPTHLIPSKAISLHYQSNSTTAANPKVNVIHTMKYPSVLLEQIASVTSVDCSANSVAVTFNDTSAFETTQSAWSATLNQTFVLVTNHLGDCDVELERGFFVVNSLSWDKEGLVCTARSKKSDVASTAAATEITFGNVPSRTLDTRALVLDPTFTINNAIALDPYTTLYSYSPYLTVSADTASFTSNVTFSGYLKYNWLSVKLAALYFDIDTSFTSELSLTASIHSAYNTTFTYAPSTLFYGLTVPGILELGPQLKFAVDAELADSEAVNLTATTGVTLSDGNVHLDVLDSSLSSTSGWNPTYSASARVSGQAAASINPTASLTVELEINFFGGLLDLSSGITAKPGFENSFMITADEGVDLSGVMNVTADGTCVDGLELKIDFVFEVDAFVTQWWSGELYSVEVPIFDECYSWI